MIKLKTKALEEATPNQGKLLFNAAGESGSRNIKINVLDVETLVEDIRNIEFRRQILFPSIIHLSNNELVCFGLYSDGRTNFACVIDCLTMKVSKDIKLHKRYLRIKGIACWKKSIYIYTKAESSIPFLWRCDLATNKFYTLAALPRFLDPFSFTCFENAILIGTKSYVIYIYDFFTNSYSKSRIQVDEWPFWIASGRYNAYYIEPNNFLFESGFKNPYVWNKIGISKLKNLDSYFSWTYHNNSLFMRESIINFEGKIEADKAYFEFNLVDKTFERKNLLKKLLNSEN